MQGATVLKFYYVIADTKVHEKTGLTKCSKCITFQVISDVVHEFMNFNALKNNFKNS